MENQVAIEVKNVTKSFKVYYDKGKELKEKMLFWKRNRYENWKYSISERDIKTEAFCEMFP